MTTAPSTSSPNGSPEYVSLSALGSHKLSARDLLPLVPATIISLIMNFALVFGLVAYDMIMGKANASSMKTVQAINVETSVDAADKDADPIEPDPVDISTGPGSMPDPGLPTDVSQVQTLGIALKPDLDVPPGIGPGDQGGNRGSQSTGNSVLPGIFTENSDIGLSKGGESGPISQVPGGLPNNDGSGSPFPGGMKLRSQADAAGRKYGANDASQRAVALGLEWLKSHQGPDGRWSLTEYHQHGRCQCKDLIFEAGVHNNDTAATALALLPFLGAGHTHKDANSRFVANVFRGLNYLINKQDAKGDLGGGMYSHSLGTIALCEAYAMSQDSKLRGSAQKAIDFIVNAQNPQTGGWRYAPRAADADTSVVAWQVMALRSGQMAGLVVPSTALEGAKRWLDKCAHDGQAQYSYMPDSAPTPAMTAAGLLNRQYLGWGERNPDLHKGCKVLVSAANLPQAKGDAGEKLGPIYYYYYASQVLHHMDNADWQAWNPLMRDKLIRLQETSGHKKGSWNPDGADHGGTGGRIYATSLAILTLEVYYRYLPLYRKRYVEPNVPMEEKK